MRKQQQQQEQEHQMQSQQQHQLFGAQPSTSSRSVVARCRSDGQRNGSTVASDCDVLEAVRQAEKTVVTPHFVVSLSPLTAVLVLCVALGLVMHAESSPVVSNEPSFDDPEALQKYDTMFERNIRAPRQKFIRFGRAGQKFIRFGRSSWDYNAPEPGEIGNEVEAFDYHPAQIRRFISSPKRAQKFIRFG